MHHFFEAQYMCIRISVLLSNNYVRDQLERVTPQKSATLDFTVFCRLQICYQISALTSVVCISVTKGCTVAHLSNALWNMWDRSIGSYGDTSDKVTSENHWQITSRVTTKIVIHGSKCIILFLTRWTHNSAESLISPLSPRTVFSNLALWRHRSRSVTSCEREVTALWRHIRRLFLHAQIDVRADH